MKSSRLAWVDGPSTSWTTYSQAVRKEQQDGLQPLTSALVLSVKHQPSVPRVETMVGAGGGVGVGSSVSLQNAGFSDCSV